MLGGSHRRVLLGITPFGGETLLLREALSLILAICVGLFQGGIQKRRRARVRKLMPKEHANEATGSSTSSQARRRQRALLW